MARRENNPFAFLQQEIDRLFDGFGRNFPAFAAPQAMMPRMDVSETDQTVEISAELPGLETKDVQLNLADNTLTIRGEKKSEREEKDKDYHLIERSFGASLAVRWVARRRQGGGRQRRDRQGCAQGHRQEAGPQAEQADRHQDSGVAALRGRVARQAATRPRNNHPSKGDQPCTSFFRRPLRAT
ncbi:Hsp20/alpha crystallin family protein [Bradyrhizobium sp. 13971]